MYRCVLLFILIFPTIVFSDEVGTELYNSGWRLNTDNDLLTGQSTDRDYTGGIAFTLSGNRVTQYPVTIDSWRAGIDELVSFPRLYQDTDYQSFHSQQYGLTLFTPDDIDSTQVVEEDRPYSSLFFMSNTKFTVSPQTDTAYVSRLTVGFLGLDLAEDVQKLIHGITDSDVPNGWQNQISSGGEPTAMLSYSIQKNLITTQQHQLKSEYEANVGFITDVNAGLSWRWGRIHSPWWAYNPYQSKYVQQSMPVFSSGVNSAGTTSKRAASSRTESRSSASKGDEFYLWAGGRLNLRIYNALLQGQFRASELTISSSDINRLVAEYWFGVTREFAGKYYASIFVRGMTDEFKGPSARSSAWVGLVFTRAY